MLKFWGLVCCTPEPIQQYYFSCCLLQSEGRPTSFAARNRNVPIKVDFTLPLLLNPLNSQNTRLQVTSFSGASISGRSLSIAFFGSVFLVEKSNTIRGFVRPSVRPSVRGSVRWSGVSEFKPKSDLTSINAPAQRLRLIWSCIRPCFLLFLSFLSSFPLFFFYSGV